MNNNTNWTLDDAAVAMNEAYNSYLKAGFTEEQALAIVLNIVSGSVCRCHDTNNREER